MRDTILSNKRIKAHVNAYGAELKSLEMDGLEYLWQGDTAYYGRTSPTLFPIMGRFLSDTYYVKDKSYHMPLNGFAMDRNFTTESAMETEAVFVLHDDARTRALFPFGFCLRVRFSLERNCLHVGFRLDNTGTDDLPFCFGFHTAYRWPLEGDEPNKAYIRFEQPEDLASFNPFNWKDPGFIRGGYKQLNHELFLNYTRSMTDIASGFIEYGSTGGKHGVRIHRSQFPYLAMWTLPDEKAGFLCLEPSTSVHAGAATTIEDRCGTLVISPGETCEKELTIELF